ncbi:UNVERIFIED_CONTAM: hypothetical protein FKN15_078207 [Acipenser sinensis]
MESFLASPSLGFYIVGAPRYQHRGRIVVFVEGFANHKQIIEGTQVGSYFGSVLCSLDFNKDGTSDVLLVGAPMYHSPNHGGLVTMYTFDTRKRIEAAQVSSRLQYFGHSLHGVMDMSGDKLPDLAVGYLGRVLVLRVEDSTDDVNFTVGRNDMKKFVEHSYETQQRKVNLLSDASLGYDKNQFIHIFTQSEKSYTQTRALTRIELYEEYNYLPVVIGSSVGGLVLLALITAGLYKPSFFALRIHKRSHQTYSAGGQHRSERLHCGPAGALSATGGRWCAVNHRLPCRPKPSPPGLRSANCALPPGNPRSRLAMTVDSGSSVE